MSNSASSMCGDGTHGQSAFRGSGVATNVIYRRSVIASEAKQSRENPGGRNQI
jgi:hypothetical protein